MQLLNDWGAHNIFLCKVLSEYLVFAVVALALFCLVSQACQRNKSRSDSKLFLGELFLEGMINVVMPVGLATIISEVLSLWFVRQRPFVAMESIKLLVPHSADGGMPSHHMVFMASLAFMVFRSNRKIGTSMFFLTVISGVGRISSGIHFPSDVLAGIVLGVVTAFLWIRLTEQLFKSKYGVGARSAEGITSLRKSRTKPLFTKDVINVPSQ